MPSFVDATERRYLQILVDKINVCRAYKPKFGQGTSTSYDEFKVLYGEDPFYSWVGLDNRLMYAAHKASGGITSLYRQIGIGCERLFQQILQDQLGITPEQAAWSYAMKVPGRKDRKLALDGRIRLDEVASLDRREAVAGWMTAATRALNADARVAANLSGSVFEVRQGYKSKDSKRQNADIGNAGTAYSQGYLPVVVLMSNQIDNDVAARYTGAGWLVLRGHLGGSEISSTYAFCNKVLGYDLAGFFTKHSEQLTSTVDGVLQALLQPTSEPGDAAELADIDETACMDV
jgi:hypothetical protein